MAWLFWSEKCITEIEGEKIQAEKQIKNLFFVGFTKKHYVMKTQQTPFIILPKRTQNQFIQKVFRQMTSFLLAQIMIMPLCSFIYVEAVIVSLKCFLLDWE